MSGAGDSPPSSNDSSSPVKKKVIKKIIKKVPAKQEEWVEKTREPKAKLEKKQDYMKVEYIKDMTARNTWYYRDR